MQSINHCFVMLFFRLWWSYQLCVWVCEEPELSTAQWRWDRPVFSICAVVCRWGKKNKANVRFTDRSWSRIHFAEAVIVHSLNIRVVIKSNMSCKFQFSSWIWSEVAYLIQDCSLNLNYICVFFQIVTKTIPGFFHAWILQKMHTKK